MPIRSTRPIVPIKSMRPIMPIRSTTYPKRTE
jgi:hypothetical protein